MMEFLLAEELFLLLHDDQSGRPNANAARDSGYAGALLLDLVAKGLLEVDGDRFVPVAGEPAHPLLGAARTAIRAEAKPRSAAYWIRWLPRALAPIEATVGRSLAQRGIVEERRAKALGLFPLTRWPQRDPAPQQALRARLGSILAGSTEPTAHDVLLTALLGPMGLVKGLVAPGEAKSAKHRAKAITESAKAGGDVSVAIARAVEAVDVALIAAIVVATSVSSG